MTEQLGNRCEARKAWVSVRASWFLLLSLRGQMELPSSEFSEPLYGGVAILPNRPTAQRGDAEAHWLNEMRSFPHLQFHQLAIEPDSASNHSGEHRNRGQTKDEQKKAPGRQKTPMLAKQ